MKRLVSFVLLTVMSIVLIASCMSGSLVNKAQTQSSTVPSNFIDHLPFIINTTGVYYITKDLTVDGDGITVLADNTVIVGQEHSIIGDKAGIGVNISSQDVALMNCEIRNFQIGIASLTDNTHIEYNFLYKNSYGIILASSNNYIFNNIIADNNVYGLLTDMSNNQIVNNHFRNSANVFIERNGIEIWNNVKTCSPNIIGGPWKGGSYWSDYTGQDLDGDGLGGTSYIIDSSNQDELPLVDINAPKYDLTTFDSALANVALNATWIDNVQVDRAILQFDGANYTDLVKTNEDLGFNEYYQAEHKAVYSRSFSNLSLGAHHYRWFANDTRNQWNSTQLLSFNVTAIPQINSVSISPILEVKANITCEGVGSITEAMDYVKLHFKIDSEWYVMNMSYNPTTKLYSALTPAYNQLANKTIQYYVEALDKNGNKLTSETYSYKTYDWIISDLNRDGKVDLKDVFKTNKNFGKAPPP